ncbi:type I restriction endonuclease subunit R [Paludisphaera mucosa]|uniref:DEAD/DEAH box helicase family protein n=1 Tax=Paludisphaera mucosa TaxID=3030827 RepID=A0ABT6FLM4_9BACT|nr:DEAD/DEAH box helicase family protein [Paludisphaera mucosa]MDG3008481.1 DEAD/DEAH box helicase family protein [Paludisphaera mucosa]
MSSELEWLTRRNRIDTRLRAWGWDVVPHGPSFQPAEAHAKAVTEYPTANGPADYALFVNGRILGIVEAKKVSLGPQNVLVQAQRYSEGATDNPLQFGSYRVPFLYSSNGEVVWFHDVRNPLERSRRVADYPTPSGLEERLARDFDGDVRKLLALPNNHSRLRPYQVEANEAVEKAVADRKRQMLVAMATGCGKTFTMVNQAYRLIKSGVARRVLFLVDRRALAAQAVRAFAGFEPEPGLKFNKIYEVFSQRFRKEDFEEDGNEEKFDPEVLPSSYLLSPTGGHAFVYVCTIQRMAINLLGRAAAFEEGDEVRDVEEADKLDIPTHAFDCIIADECHRGYTSAELSTWRTVLDYFDAVKVGLTATPAAHTTAYFTDVVYRYEYRRAVEEGYLVDYDAVAVDSDIRMKGLFLKEGEHVGLVDTATGGQQLDFLEDERAYDASDIERKATAPDSNRKVVEELKKYALEHEAKYGRFPKTLIFATNDLPHTSHADQLVNLCREVFGRGEAFVQKITGSPTVDRPLKRIREFRNRPNPAVVVTVDMLSTGVDVPDLEFIVFLRPVKSRILFEQMLGRGTRKGEHHPDKSHFTVFDCFDGTLLAYFKQASAFTSEPPAKPTRPIKEIIEDVWNNKDRAYNVGCLVKRLQRIDKEMSGEARTDFAAFIADGDLGRFAKTLKTAVANDFTGTMKLLRNESFQDLLANYRRPQRGFVIAHEAKDVVTSRWLIRDGTGKEHRPEDYLKLFADYVRENPDQVDAIRILFDRPKEWGTEALGELRRKLATTKHRFTEVNLLKAHEAAYHKPLVDIISMVKHAADESAPLLTAEERVDKALAKLKAGKTFSADEERWLGRIREHLAANLSIDRDDFDDVPVLSREGGWVQANRVFQGKLAGLLLELNEAMAA